MSKLEGRHGDLLFVRLGGPEELPTRLREALQVAPVQSGRVVIHRGEGVNTHVLEGGAARVAELGPEDGGGFEGTGVALEVLEPGTLVHEEHQVLDAKTGVVRQEPLAPGLYWVRRQREAWPGTEDGADYRLVRD